MTYTIIISALSALCVLLGAAVLDRKRKYNEDTQRLKCRVDMLESRIFAARVDITELLGSRTEMKASLLRLQTDLSGERLKRLPLQEQVRQLGWVFGYEWMRGDTRPDRWVKIRRQLKKGSSHE